MRCLFTFLMLVGLSCDNADKLLTFRITNEASFTVESNSILDLPFDIATPQVATESQQSFANNNTRADLVREVHLEEMVLTIVAPTGKTFSFLESIQIFISTDSHETLLASLDDIAAAGTISLNTTDEALDRYVKSDAFSLRVRVVTDEVLDQDVDVEAQMRFRVRANAL